ncbi:MAG: sodium-dependent transporter [Lachnoclostridium sp.]|nr:sodium-dependent transporter [Lachnoclostridium sp.]
MISDRKERATFSTKIGAVAATVGSAVGLGNIWRFPYEAGAHGGGAFLLCYIAFVLVIGIPLLCAEFCIGRGTRSCVPEAFRKVEPSGKWHLTGYMVIATSLLILCFYSVVAGWTLEYCYSSVTGALNFNSTASGHDHFTDLISGSRNILWTAIFLLCNLGVLLGGVTKGIERASNVLMPLLFVLLVVFCINSFTLPGFRQGMEFLFRPDFSAITPEVLLSAMGQAFFSLSLAMGCMMIYASYFNKDSRLGRTATTTAVLDTLVAILAGVVIFPAVFSFGISPSAGSALVFEVLPYVFANIPGGVIWSTLFFLLLFVATLTSTISLSEISISYFVEARKMSRRNATLLSTTIIFIGATLCALSLGMVKELSICGMTLFDFLDFVTSNICLPIIGFIVSIFVGWIVPRKFVKAQLTDNGSYRFGAYGLLMFSLRWICPGAILLIFLNSIGII